jgi:hypothetical protein
MGAPKRLHRDHESGIPKQNTGKLKKISLAAIGMKTADISRAKFVAAGRTYERH